MHMNFINYDIFAQDIDIFFELSKKLLIEKILYLSICYFTMATEYRFMDMEEKEKNTKISEILHLKSI